MSEFENTYEKNLKQIKEMRLFDDEFFRACVKNDKKVMEELLKRILSKPDLHVLEIESQLDLKNLHGRSTVLDIHAVDNKGTHYNIEIERSNSKVNPKNLRYHSSILDTYILKRGENSNTIADSYIIYISENDPFGQGEPIYPVNSYLKIKDELIPYEDGRNLLMVNGEYRGDDPLGQLMHDFAATNPDEMYYDFLANKVRYFKEDEKGVIEMSSVFDDVRREGRKEGRREGRKEGIIKTARNLFKQGFDFNQVSKACPDIDQNELILIQKEALSTNS